MHTMMRFPVLTPAISPSGQVEFLTVCLADVREIRVVKLPSHRPIPGRIQMVTDVAVELTLADQREPTPALFADPRHLTRVIADLRAGRCPQCHIQGGGHRYPSMNVPQCGINESDPNYHPTHLDEQAMNGFGSSNGAA